MTLMALKAVHKSYLNRQVLSGISLHIAEGERIGLVGMNGSGKSTILRILAGTETPDEGERVVRRDLNLGYLPQEPMIDPDLTIMTAVRQGLPGRDELMAELSRVHDQLSHASLGAEQIEALLARQAILDGHLEQLGGHDIDHEAEAIISRLGLPAPDKLCGPLSGGEKRRVALARLLLSSPDVLLLDEPTNHLDAIVIDWLEDFLLASRTPLVLVTHDRYFLDRVVHRIVELDRGQLFNYDGGYGDYVVARADRLAAEGKAEHRRLDALRRETVWMKRGPPARTTKAKARIGRYQSLVDSAPIEASPDLEFNLPPGPRLGDRVLRFTGVRKALGGKLLIDGLDLDIEPGTRLGIVGPNGAGKTTFLQLCMGRITPDAGTVAVGPTVKFASIEQTRVGLDPSKTVLEEVGGDYDHVRYGDRTMRIESFLEQFLFPGAMKHTRVDRLSGGERNRVLLAKLLCQAGNVIVLDEPTNDLDLVTLRVLEEALRAFAGVVLVVSHDRYFLDRVATRIVHLDGSGRHRVHDGDLSGLLAKIAAERAGARAEPTARVKTSEPARPREKRLGSKERRELSELPERIAKVEAELGSFDEALGNPTLYGKPPAELRELMQKRERAQAKVAELYRRWEELDAMAS